MAKDNGLKNVVTRDKCRLKVFDGLMLHYANWCCSITNNRVPFSYDTELYVLHELYDALKNVFRVSRKRNGKSGVYLYKEFYSILAKRLLYFKILFL